MTVASPYIFSSPLQEGIILDRPNRFIMDIVPKNLLPPLPAGELSNHWLSTIPQNNIYRCHCPVVSRIGNLNLEGRPCLFSQASNPKRKLGYTVEAFSLDHPNATTKTWIGINQTASNRYIAYFLNQGAFSNIFPVAELWSQEKTWGNSRLDFFQKESNCLLEIKTPLAQLEIPIPSYIKQLPSQPFRYPQRTIKHLQTLIEAKQQGKQAYIFYCFYYPNQDFHYLPGPFYEELATTVIQAIHQGVQFWQIQCTFKPQGITLTKWNPLTEKQLLRARLESI